LFTPFDPGRRDHLHPVAGSVQAAAPESQDTATADETLTVLGQTYRNTATKTRLDPIETPQAISVVDGETLSLRGVSSVSEALRYVPGVNTELRGGAVNRLDLFNIRGFDNYQNFYDGLLLQYNDWNLQPQIDPVAIEQLECSRGRPRCSMAACPRRHGQPHRQAPQRRASTASAWRAGRAPSRR
jgi:iron complex outermembrane receptor protein